MNLIFEVDKALVVGRDKRLEDLAYRHDSLTHGDLALLALEAGQILHMHVVQPRPNLVDGLHHIDPGTHRMPDVDAAPDARVVLLHRLQHIERGVPQLVLRSMIVDSDADVILLHEFFDPWKSLRRRIAGDDDRNARSLAIFKLAANIVIFVLWKVDGPGSVKLDACSSVVRKRLSLRP